MENVNSTQNAIPIEQLVGYIAQTLPGRAVGGTLASAVAIAATVAFESERLQIQIVGVYVFIVFSVIALGQFGYLLAFFLTGIEAAAEHVVRRDLNQSGAVGDVGTRLPSDDTREFVSKIKVFGLRRSNWLGHKFQSGRECDRKCYDGIIDNLVRVGAVVDRGQGTDGRLAMNEDEILKRLA